MNTQSGQGVGTAHPPGDLSNPRGTVLNEPYSGSPESKVTNKDNSALEQHKISPEAQYKSNNAIENESITNIELKKESK